MDHLCGRTRLLSLVALTALLAACISGPAAGASSSPAPSDASAVAAQPSPDCITTDVSVNAVPPTVANLMGFSKIVVVAQVKSLEAGVWNTKDGAQPGQGVKAGPRFNPAIVTPVNLQVTDTWFGDAGPGAMRVVNQGGTAGCSQWNVNIAPDLQKGGSYVFFLQPSADADGQGHPELPVVLRAWLVDATGQVETPEDGSLTIAQLESLVRHPVAPSATPEPTPAGSDHPG
jgi:hypothetical protein